ncbi:McrB family protein [Pseudogemmobacter faecipullorum]|uniref:Chromosome segregation ATPase-like protein n=1 Tax=Pseudogemmobacter faecipullorum TaxID=2755041 RepID=A0ABS8CSA1_9RHOB|nr:chromosome segregation ATPase-like protein [Pseudogemmobacter faecipullorum]MCB5412276.1 chromosome segregation ATPase-like protein [Pseudogemmobacter faecipullorum]
MFATNIFVFLAAALFLVLLALVMVFLAKQHDHAVALAGPLEEVKAVEARVAEKRATLLDLEADLQKRREALAHVAELGAEVDALARKRDDLLTEWNQSQARRDEVQALRAETEAAVTESLAVEGELASKRLELEEVRERLLRAEELVGRIEGLNKERDALEANVTALRDKERELITAQTRLEELRGKSEDLEDSHTELEGKIRAKIAELDELESRITAARVTSDEERSERDRLNAELAAHRLRVGELAPEVQALEARKAFLDDEIRKLQATASGQSPDEGDDPLRELKQAPPVILGLQSLSEHRFESEAAALNSVKHRFEDMGLSYPDRVLRAFHTAMKVNDTTQMAVLAGISGTGKSQLPRQYAAGMGIGFLQVPVQPRWDSPQDLMGFYNYIEGRFRPTDMARALYALDTHNNPDALHDRMLMVLLDEMNLARVEYYFSDFLSRLESRPAKGCEGDATLRKDAEIELEIPKRQTRLFPGYNLLFAGTMNEDESTQSLSDKVVDRANVLRFGAPEKLVAAKAVKPSSAEVKALSRKTWDNWGRNTLKSGELAEINGTIDTMLGLMQELGKPFGHRLGRAIQNYAAVYPEVEGMGNRRHIALADQIEMRLLPKLRGVDVEEKRHQFDQIRSLASQLGDDVLAEAIGISVNDAEATGQFVWKGVKR